VPSSTLFKPKPRGYTSKSDHASEVHPLCLEGYFGWELAVEAVTCVVDTINIICKNAFDA